MAENTFNLGIERNSVLGDVQAMDDFLSDTTTVTAKPADITKVDDKPKEEKPKDEPVKPEAAEVINSFLEEEKPTDTTKPKTEEKVDDKEETSSNTFENLSEEMFKTGVFSLEDGEEKVLTKTPQEFLERFREESEKGASKAIDTFLSKFGQDRRDMFDAIFVDGVDPKDYLPTFNQIENLQTLEIPGNEVNQEKVTRLYYEKLGWDKVTIDKKIEKLKSYAELESEAETVHPLLIQKDKEELARVTLAQQQKQQAIQREEQGYANATGKILEDAFKAKSLAGIPVTEKVKNEAYSFLNQKKWQLPNGELLTDFDVFILNTKKPENIEQRAKIALLAMNNFDFSKITAKAISEKSEELFSSLTQKEAKKSNTTKTTQAPTGSWT
jgi:hypothetical protein